jgi:BR serine/threonine kinase
VVGSAKTEPELELPMAEVIQTHIIPTEENIDPDVFRHMNSLGCFKDKEKLIKALLNSTYVFTANLLHNKCPFSSHNTEKMVYFLLLDRKRRRPAAEDDTETMLRQVTNAITAFDPPKKRTDQAQITTRCACTRVPTYYL